MPDYTPTYSKRTMADYAKMLVGLLPKGKLWPNDENSVWYKLCYAFGKELLRIDDRMKELLVERDSRTTVELISDFERDLGIPDECSQVGATIAERQAQVHSKLINVGGLHKQDYIDIATGMGITITITEYQPFWVGYHGMGDPIGDQSNIFHWKVTVAGWENGNLIATMQCIFEKNKPAHTTLLWEIVGADAEHSFTDIDGGFDFEDIDGGFGFVDIS